MRDIGSSSLPDASLQGRGAWFLPRKAMKSPDEADCSARDMAGARREQCAVCGCRCGIARHAARQAHATITRAAVTRGMICAWREAAPRRAGSRSARQRHGTFQRWRAQRSHEVMRHGARCHRQDATAHDVDRLLMIATPGVTARSFTTPSGKKYTAR